MPDGRMCAEGNSSRSQVWARMFITHSPVCIRIIGILWCVIFVPNQLGADLVQGKEEVAEVVSEYNMISLSEG